LAAAGICLTAFHRGGKKTASLTPYDFGFRTYQFQHESAWKPIEYSDIKQKDKNMNSYRTIARIVGVLFLAGMVIGIAGNILIQSVLGAPNYLSTISANSMKVAIGAMLLLMTVAGDAAHGVLMFPVLKQHNEYIALGYFVFRIVDAVFLGIQVLFILFQIPLGSQYLNAGISSTSHLQSVSSAFIQTNLYAYHIAMLTLGIAGLMLCCSFYKTKLVPRLLAIWGIVGYAAILCGSALEVLGFNLNSIDTIPGGLWEVFIGVWLILKGFNYSAIDTESDKTNN